MIKLFSGLFLLSICFSARAFELERLSSYELHRERFNTVLTELKDYNVEMANWSSNQVDQSLSTEVAVVKNKVKNKNLKPKKVLVLSSGIHGVEAYVGSSVQIAFIKEYLSQPQEKFDFVFIHILNPWGMKNNRRVNSENVDLNRNFLAKQSDFEKKNESYNKIDSFLNPKTQLQLHFAQKFLFFLDSMYYILRFSIESLRQSILQGQYHSPQGIYYGGSKADELKSYADQFVSQKLSDYEEIYWIDLHTGYGERGRLHLLANDASDENSKRLKDFFPGQHVDYGQNQKFYKTTGDMISYLASTTGSGKLTGVAFEYGTMDSQKPLGSIESLRRMVIENQSYNFNGVDQSRKSAESLILEMFNPPEEAWWKSIASQTQKLFDQILK